MGPQPATDFVVLLESSRQDFLAAFESVSDERAAAKPDPARWSALECAEHVIIVEERFLGWLETAQRTDIAQPDAGKESGLFTRIQDRSTRVQAPESVHPTGRYRTVEEARALFNAIRDRSIQMAREQGAGLYLLNTDQHRRFGPMNGAELMHVIAGHSRRHAAQIREALSI